MDEKEIGYSLGTLGQGCQTSQKVAISQKPLFDAVGADLAEDLGIGHGFGYPFPLNIFPFRNVSPLTCQRAEIRREAIINKIRFRLPQFLQFLFRGTGFNKNKLFSNIFDEIDIFNFIDISFVFLDIFLDESTSTMFLIYFGVIIFDNGFVFWLVAFSSVYDLGLPVGEIKFRGESYGFGLGGERGLDC